MPIKYSNKKNHIPLNDLILPIFLSFLRFLGAFFRFGMTGHVRMCRLFLVVSAVLARGHMATFLLGHNSGTCLPLFGRIAPVFLALIALTLIRHVIGLRRLRIISQFQCSLDEITGTRRSAIAILKISWF